MLLFDSFFLSWIFSSLPENKQMLALSATYPESLAQQLTRYMREPTFVRLNPTDMSLKGTVECRPLWFYRELLWGLVINIS